MKTILSCAGILGGLLSSQAYNIPSLKIEGQTNLELRLAVEHDVTATTDLIRSAYSYWVENGVLVSPATQSIEKTRSHLLKGRGFVAIDSSNNVRATFSLDDIELKTNDRTISAHSKHSGNQIEYELVSDTDSTPDGKYLEFKKLAVDRNLSGQGIGRRLYEIAEEYARKNNYDGIILETVKEATWLYEWYLRMGFKVQGNHKYSGSNLKTLLLVKKFE